jgi:hypothetical protein
MLHYLIIPASFYEQIKHFKRQASFPVDIGGKVAGA